jgi:hypothetical protein
MYSIIKKLSCRHELAEIEMDSQIESFESPWNCKVVIMVVGGNLG